MRAPSLPPPPPRSAEPIFPPELRRRSPPELALEGPVAAWHRPSTLAGLLALKAKHPDAKIVAGNTGGWVGEGGWVGGCAPAPTSPAHAR